MQLISAVVFNNEQLLLYLTNESCADDILR